MSTATAVALGVSGIFVVGIVTYLITRPAPAPRYQGQPAAYGQPANSGYAGAAQIIGAAGGLVSSLGGFFHDGSGGGGDSDITPGSGYDLGVVESYTDSTPISGYPEGYG